MYVYSCMYVYMYMFLCMHMQHVCMCICSWGVSGQHVNTEPQDPRDQVPGSHPCPGPGSDRNGDAPLLAQCLPPGIPGMPSAQHGWVHEALDTQRSPGASV